MNFPVPPGIPTTDGPSLPDRHSLLDGLSLPPGHKLLSLPIPTCLPIPLGPTYKTWTFEGLVDLVNCIQLDKIEVRTEGPKYL